MAGDGATATEPQVQQSSANRQNKYWPLGLWIVTFVNLALAAWSGLTPRLASSMVFGKPELADDIIVLTLWRLLAAGFLVITGVAYALKEAAESDTLHMPTARLTDLGLLLHETLSLALFPSAAPLLRHEALLAGPPVFVTAGSIAAFHFVRSVPSGHLKESTMQTVKVTTRADSKVGLVYLLLSGAFAALALVCIFTPTLFLKSTFGNLGPPEAAAMVRTLGGGFLLPTAVFTYALKDGADRQRLMQRIHKILNTTLAAAALLKAAALAPIAQKSGLTSGAGTVSWFFGVAGAFFTSQAVSPGAGN